MKYFEICFLAAVLVLMNAPQSSRACVTFTNISTTMDRIAKYAKVYWSFTSTSGCDVIQWTVHYDSVRPLSIFSNKNQTRTGDFSIIVLPSFTYDIYIEATLRSGQIIKSPTYKYNAPKDKPYHAPENFRITSVGHDSVTATWNKLMAIYRNGDIKGYKIIYRENRSTVRHSWNVVGEDTLSTTVIGLKPSTQYDFIIAAVNEKGQGTPSSPFQTITTLNTPPSTVTAPVVSTSTPKTHPSHATNQNHVTQIIAGGTNGAHKNTGSKIPSSTVEPNNEKTRKKGDGMTFFGFDLWTTIGICVAAFFLLLLLLLLCCCLCRCCCFAEPPVEDKKERVFDKRPVDEENNNNSRPPTQLDRQESTMSIQSVKEDEEPLPPPPPPEPTPPLPPPPIPPRAPIPNLIVVPRVPSRFENVKTMPVVQQLPPEKPYTHMTTTATQYDPMHGPMIRDFGTVTDQRGTPVSKVRPISVASANVQTIQQDNIRTSSAMIQTEVIEKPRLLSANMQTDTIKPPSAVSAKMQTDSIVVPRMLSANIQTDRIESPVLSSHKLPSMVSANIQTDFVKSREKTQPIPIETRDMVTSPIIFPPSVHSSRKRMNTQQPLQQKKSFVDDDIIVEEHIEPEETAMPSRILPSERHSSVKENFESTVRPRHVDHFPKPVKEEERISLNERSSSADTREQFLMDYQSETEPTDYHPPPSYAPRPLVQEPEVEPEVRNREHEKEYEQWKPNPVHSTVYNTVYSNNVKNTDNTYIHNYPEVQPTREQPYFQKKVVPLSKPNLAKAKISQFKSPKTFYDSFLDKEQPFEINPSFRPTFFNIPKAKSPEPRAILYEPNWDG